MERNYWQEYWDNYYKFMAVYLSELQNAYPDEDLTDKYVEAADLFAPSMPLEEDNSYVEYDDGDDYNISQGGNNPSPFIFPGGGSSNFPFLPPGGGPSPAPAISPGAGQFTINNCRRMAIVRMEMRRGFIPSSFFMVVDRADSRSIRGFRIACEAGGRIRFVPIAVEYRNINVIEFAF